MLELPQLLTRNGSVSAEMVAFVRGSGMRRPSDVICSLKRRHKPSASGDDACYILFPVEFHKKPGAGKFDAA